ncbi:Rpn family recombination-promoting nuclease/putative transposase [Wolbachia pipientis]|uniref:Rpn family recombination-promoting nuclease/putative transposase n=1 Tax=Wolbachia pipientis TaxID=955 RepID=UPI002030972F|nr:Rpn family recombination-promoting nuclease/putative transposase [Wolbachia pipientis]MCM1001761.1 Rpn family recombination-promoting nuclease/putative transposase [Wolbachia pipientis]
MVLSKFLDPKNNYAFRRIFGTEKNKDILIHFLNDILGHIGEVEIKDVTFLSPIQNPDIAAKKESIVDVLCRDSTGVQKIVEMQVARTSGFEKRAQYYAAKAYSSQADIGARYQDLKGVIFIAITDFVLFPNKPEYKSDHVTLDQKTFKHDLEDFSFTFIELPKFPKTKEDQLESIVEKWCYFFRYANETSDEDLRKIVGNDEIIGRAYDELNQYNWSEEERFTYNQDKKREDDNLSCLNQKFDEGMERGKIEVARNLLKAGISIDIISQTTGLPQAEIKQLQEEVT